MEMEDLKEEEMGIENPNAKRGSFAVVFCVSI